MSAKRLKLTPLGLELAKRIVVLIKWPSMNEYEATCTCGKGDRIGGDHAEGCPFAREMIDDLEAAAAAVGMPVREDDGARWRAILVLLATAGGSRVFKLINEDPNE